MAYLAKVSPASLVIVCKGKPAWGPDWFVAVAVCCVIAPPVL